MLQKAWQSLRSLVRPGPDLAAASSPGEMLPPLPESPDLPQYYTPVFDYDGVRNDPAIIHNHDFMKEPRFRRAMQRALQAHGDSVQFWRLHTALWAAAHAVRLPGDFVECGVWKGFLSSGIMSYLEWNRLDKKFFLFDTFCGIDESQVSPEEFAKGNMPHFRKHYVDNYDEVVRNFSEFRNVVVVRGSVPASLRSVAIDAVAYLSLDMNNARPEIEAAEHFWDRLVPGGVILLDDYGFVSYEEQKRAFDAFAQRHGVPLLALPTGQGLILKS